MSEEMRGRLRERYSEAARGARGKDGGGGCCDPSCCGFGSEARKAVLTEGSYSEEDLGRLPEEAVGPRLVVAI